MTTQSNEKSIWELAPPGALPAPELIEKYKIRPLLARLLSVRGLADGAALPFLFDPGLSCLHDPFLMADMDRAAARINSALDQGERIIVYGDYDVDGITSVYILTDYLRSRGADCGYYIPDRDGEGYGLNPGALAELARAGAGLVITADSGVTACAEAALAAELGVGLVITDHHEPGPELPACDAVVNPRRGDCPYPFKELAGVGVAFKLICALDGDTEKIFQTYGDMVALGTIADVMALRDENRAIAKHGLDLLSRTKNTGLATLMRLCGVQGAGADSVAFRLAPRLNAAGRMSSADRAVELLLAADRESAAALAGELCELNTRRQAHEGEIFRSAVKEISNRGGEFFENKIIVLRNDEWRQGVVGIVASRLAEKYGLPTLLLTTPSDVVGEDGVVLKGSGRSVPGFNLFSAVTRAAEGIGSAGGHEMAAGVKLPAEKFDEFRTRLFEYARTELSSGVPGAKFSADLETELSELTLENVSDLSRLEPFGAGNPQPLFIIRDVRVDSAVPVGEGRHTRLSFSSGGISVTGMFFGRAPEGLPVSPGTLADLLCGAEVNRYRGLSSVRLNLRDIRHAESERAAQREALDLYRRVLAGENTGLKAPNRPELARVWRALDAIRAGRDGQIRTSLNDLSARLAAPGGAGMLIALRAFYEAGLLDELSFDGADFDAELLFSFAPVRAGRADLDACPVIRGLSGRPAADGE